MSDNEPESGDRRITVNLGAKAADNLRSLQERTGLNKTDVVNRAVNTLAFIDERQGDCELVVRNRSTGAEQIVCFL